MRALLLVAALLTLSPIAAAQIVPGGVVDLCESRVRDCRSALGPLALPEPDPVEPAGEASLPAPAEAPPAPAEAPPAEAPAAPSEALIAPAPAASGGAAPPAQEDAVEVVPVHAPARAAWRIVDVVGAIAAALAVAAVLVVLLHPIERAPPPRIPRVVAQARAAAMQADLERTLKDAGMARPKPQR